MNHQFQVSNEKEDKASSPSQEEEENAQEWPNYFTSPSATLVPSHHKEEIKKVSLKRKLKRAKQDVMEVHGSRIVRATGKKDRHSKVSTASGTKDRRVRLSPNTAIQFYDVQDRLGYDRPSKAIDWLIKESRSAISALQKTPFQASSRKIDSMNAEKEEGQYAADTKTESKHNARKHYLAERFPEGSYKEQNSRVCSADAKIQSLSDSQIRNLRLFSSAHGSKIQSFCEFQTYPQNHFHSETKKQSANDVKIQSFSELQTYPHSHFHSETEKQSPNDVKIQSFSGLKTYPQGHFHSDTEKQSANDAKIQSFCELQTYPQGHFHSETKKQSASDAKIQSFCELLTYPQGHLHSETEKQSPNDVKIQSFSELQTYPQGHLHSETEKQSPNDVKIQSFSGLKTYPQGHFHSETEKQSANDAKIQSFCELQTYPQSHFHSETEKQSANDAKIQSFSELQTYPQSHFHSETKKQSPNDAKIQSFSELQTYPQGHFHSETKNQLANFINFHSSHQNESISFSSDHHHQALLTKTSLESRQDSSFSFSPQNFPTILSQNEMFNFQREPLQSTSNIPQTISYSNNTGLSTDGLLGLCTAPIIQEEEEEQGSLLLHYQD